MINGNERANEVSAIPRILGDAGKSKEVSSVFAAILCRGCYQGNESQRTVQDNWLASKIIPSAVHSGLRPKLL